MTEKITPQTFNDAAWNMGITIRWNDSNQNGTVESSEVTCYGNASDFYNDETADKIIAAVKKGANISVSSNSAEKTQTAGTCNN